MLKCYVCGCEDFVVHLKTTSTVEVINGIPCLPNEEDSWGTGIDIVTILCSKCGVMQYCAESKDPWYVGQVSLVWDEEKQILVDRKKVDVTNYSITSEELTKLLREYVNQGGKIEEIIKKKEEK